MSTRVLKPFHPHILSSISILFENFILLWIGLFGTAGCLLLNQAPETFMAILQAAVIMHFLKDRLLIQKLDRELVIPLVIIMIPLILNLFCQNGLTKDRYAKELTWSLFIITSFWILSEGLSKKNKSWLLTAVNSVLCIFLLAQAGVFLLQKNYLTILPILQNYFSKPYLKAIQVYAARGGIAMFSNIHFFALYAVITLPVSLFCILKSKSISTKLLLIFCSVCIIFLLLTTGSRPGWLALVAATLVAAPFAQRGKRLLHLAILFFVLLILYCGNILEVKLRVNDLLFNLAHEERVTIWADAWQMQKASDWQGWLIGHGLGSFSHYFKAYSHYTQLFIFPHNFFLEILFDSGLIALIVVIIGYASFYYALITLWLKTLDKGHKSIAVVLISVMTAHFVHAFLTLPFLTGRAILSLAIIVGVGTMLLKLEKQRACELPPAYDHHS